MTKFEIIKIVMEETGLQKYQSEATIDAILNEIKNTLRKGKPVTLRKFGTFSVVKKKKRMGRNPKTGKKAVISARKIVNFKAGRYLKEAVNKY